MKTCSNCGSAITCGCQERVASNGVKVCANCYVNYEQQLHPQLQQPHENPAPIPDAHISTS